MSSSCRLFDFSNEEYMNLIKVKIIVAISMQLRGKEEFGEAKGMPATQETAERQSQS